MIPPDFVDAALVRAARADAELEDAIQLAATYRYLTAQVLALWHREMELRRRTELRLRELLQMPDEQDAYTR